MDVVLGLVAAILEAAFPGTIWRYPALPTCVRNSNNLLAEIVL